MKLYEQYLLEKEERAHILKRPSAELSRDVINAAVTTGLAKSLKNEVGPVGKKLLAGAVALQVFFVANSIYQRYLSKAARSCAGDKFKMACIYEYKANALAKSIKFLESSKAKCKETNDPNKCIEKIERKIRFNTFRMKNFKQSVKYMRHPKFFVKTKDLK